MNEVPFELEDVRETQLLLRKELYLKIKARGVNKVASTLGIKPNQLSRLFKTLDKRNFDRLIGLSLLDSLTELFGLPVGYYYSIYIGELRKRTRGIENTSSTYFLEEKVKAFIKRCLDLEKYTLVDKILTQLSKEKSIRVVFEMAEAIFHYAEKKYPYNPDSISYLYPEYQQCLYLYEFVIKNGKSFRDYLAVSYLRKYYIRRFDPVTVHEDLILMKHFTKFMPKNQQLEAWERICSYNKMYFRWNDLFDSAIELKKLAEGVDEDKYGYGLLCEAFALTEMKKFSEALEKISKYEGIKGFEIHAELNRMIVLLRQGDLSYVDKLIECCFNNAGQLAKQSTLLTVIEKLMEFGQADKAFSLIKRCMEEEVYPSNSKSIYVAVKIMRFKKVKGEIYLKNTIDINRGIDLILDAAEIALQINDTKTYGELISIYKEYQERATIEQLKRGV